MKRMMMIAVCLAVMVRLQSQQQPMQELEEEVESMVEKSDEVMEDETRLQQLEMLRKHPLQLNRISEQELNRIGILSPFQVKNFIRYRSLLGNLVHVNELQAIPGWDVSLIRKLLPFITIEETDFIPVKKLLPRFNNGEYKFLLRLSQSNRTSEEPSFTGSPQNIQLRFQYRFGNALQYGLVAEKDAGEPYFKNSGFDFYSFHLFMTDVGIFKKLAIGDFTVKMGQGLIQWQGLANKKNANVLSIKKEDEIITPYHSAGEINFHRGLAFTIERDHWELTGFASERKLSGNLKQDSTGHAFFSSLSTSGYHRTASEIAGRSKVGQFSAGGNISYSNAPLRVGVNVIGFNFSLPVRKVDEPYQLFGLDGKSLLNWSAEYEYSFQNLHLFGELAVDNRMKKALLNGVLLSLDRRFDVSMIFRSIAPAYQSMYASAFTENTSPSNETGIYLGMSWRLFAGGRLDGYVDLYSFPWLKYRVDAPSEGKDFFLQLNWQPSKDVLVYTRWKQESNGGNEAATNNPSKKIIDLNRQEVRMQINWEYNKNISLRQRMDKSWYNSGSINEGGFLLYQDIFYQPKRKWWKISGRLMVFDTDGYDARIYAAENDISQGFAVFPFSGKGVHYSINGYLKPKTSLPEFFHRQLDFGLWVSWSQTIVAGNPASTNSNTEKTSRIISNFKFQMVMNW